MEQFGRIGDITFMFWFSVDTFRVVLLQHFVTGYCLDSWVWPVFGKLIIENNNLKWKWRTIRIKIK